jgi:WD40 repeat protein
MDGRSIIVTAGEDGIHRWDATNGAACPRHPDERTMTIWDVAVAHLPNGRAIVAGAGHDGLVYRWDAASGAAFGEPLRGHTISVKAIAATSHPEDGSAVLVSGCERGEVRCWDVVGGEQINETVQLPGEMITDLDVVELRDGSRLLVCLDLDGKLHRHDPFHARALGEPITAGAKWPTGLATYVGPDDRPVAHTAFTCDDGSGNSVTSWRLDDGTRVDDPATPPPGTIGVFPVDGRIVEVVASAPGAVTIRAQDLNRRA